jgi:hypothetical protein
MGKLPAENVVALARLMEGRVTVAEGVVNKRAFIVMVNALSPARDVTAPARSSAIVLCVCGIHPHEGAPKNSFNRTRR